MTIMQYIIVLRPVETILKERSISFIPSLHQFNHRHYDTSNSLNYDYFHDWLKQNNHHN